MSVCVSLFLWVETRQETCIICNQYPSLMCLRSPSQPIMDLFWGSPHLVWLLMVTEWGQRMSPGKKQGERWDLSFTCQEASIVFAWHGVLIACTISSRPPFHKEKHDRKVTTLDRTDTENLAFLSGDAHLSNNVQASRTQRVTLLQWVWERKRWKHFFIIFINS